MTEKNLLEDREAFLRLADIIADIAYHVRAGARPSDIINKKVADHVELVAERDAMRSLTQMLYVGSGSGSTTDISAAVRKRLDAEAPKQPAKQPVERNAEPTVRKLDFKIT